MDSIVSAALEEACVRGAGGIPLPDLWRGLRAALASAGLHACGPVKEAVWTRLLANPALRFEASGGPVEPRDPSVQSLDEAERLGVRVVAEDHLRDSFLGIYDLKHAHGEVSKDQRRALERLALARNNGVTQNELAKEFCINGNNMFYIVRSLECQQLVVRQSTTVRTEAEGENGLRNTSIVNTNLIRLHRYAKDVNFNSQQRIEITRPDMLESFGNLNGGSLTQHDVSLESVKEDVRINDFLPAMKAICEILEEADGKVLIVSDIKRALGYRETRGHRAWRNILHRLKDVGLVEEFYAKVKGKSVSCLRLVKKFESKDFHQKAVSCGYDGFETENSAERRKRGQITDQLVELPFNHSIYDMIDAEGHKGVTVPEVSKRFGIGLKRMYNRLADMRSRFGLCMLPEMHKKTKIYRVWTADNYKIYSSNTFPSNIPDRDEIHTRSGNLISCHQSSPNIQTFDCGPINDISHHSEVQNREIALQPPSICSTCSRTCTCTGTDQQTTFSSSQNQIHQIESMDNPVMPGCVRTVTQLNVVPPDRLSSLLMVSSEPQASGRHPSLVSTVAGVRREQRILERLEKEKFILSVDLHKWLEGLEGLEREKSTMMDKKTLTRILNKLQKEGSCKCCEVIIPGVTNCSSRRKTVVILHPSVNISDILDQVHQRQRLFDIQSRGRAAGKFMKDQTVAVIADLKRASSRADDRHIKVGAMSANGFVSAKMVRAKLLHNFLWGYLSSLPDWPKSLNSTKHSPDLKDPHNTYQLFALGTALKAMPLELFLQVVGSPKEIGTLVESCKSGLRLLDLPIQEYKRLMDTQAIGRLSSLIDILIRLKLIRLVREGGAEDVNVRAQAVLTHAMELKPHIEEPLQNALPSSNLNSLYRHQNYFVLSSQEVVNEYWETLEYFYSAADQAAASHAFPGSAVPEVFHPRSWASVRVMTIEQRMELLKCMTNADPEKKISFKDCIKISRELNLTLEQVLRFSYDRRQSRLHKYRRILKSNEQETHLESENNDSVARKRKRSSNNGSLKHAQVVSRNRKASQLAMPIISECNGQEMNTCPFSPASIESYEGPLGNSGDGTCFDASRELMQHEDDDEHSLFVNQLAVSRLKPLRRKKFKWSDNSDRQLVMQYARCRAMLGARFNRVLDWTSISGLPALPDTCRRRMAMLKSDENTRKALMRLCNLLGEHYSRFLDRRRNSHGQEVIYHIGSGQSNQDAALSESLSQQSSVISGNTSGSSIEERWDDFEDPSIKDAIDEVLQYKRMVKIEYANRFGSRDVKEWSDIPPTDGTNLDQQARVASREQNVSSSSLREESHDRIQSRQESTGTLSSSGRNKSRSQHLRGRFLKAFNSRGIRIRRQVCESLAVANVVELLKLLYLNTCTVPEVENSLSEILKLYSQRDVNAALNYLNEKDFMVLGHGSRQHVLSEKFWHKAAASPFPVDTGKRAANLSNWLCKQEKDLMDDGVDLNLNLQCGEVIHLFALVSSGEIFISPCLPKEGVGEDSAPKSSKRKCDQRKLTTGGRFKKHKTSKENHTSSFYRPDARRGKGFPGIKVVLRRAIASSFQCLTVGDNDSCPFPCDEMMLRDPFSNVEITNYTSFSSNVNLHHNLGCTSQSVVPLNEMDWDSMSGYAAFLQSNLAANSEVVTISSEIFKSAYSAIHQAGEQGLNMEEISRVIVLEGLELVEMVLDTLEAFRLAIKVNAYDDLRVVDSSYRSKYFLRILPCHDQVHGLSSCIKSQVVTDEASQRPLEEKNGCDVNVHKNTSMKTYDGHSMSISNLSKEAAMSHIEFQATEEHTICEGTRNVDVVSVQGKEVRNNKYPMAEELPGYRPILPWINGDGSINAVVYKGLTRRILGTVMQNPGLLEEDIISRVDVLNPQSCRQLLELLVLDNHLIVRMMHQITASAPPSILRNLLGSNFVKPKSVLRKHYFANPMSTHLL